MDDVITCATIVCAVNVPLTVKLSADEAVAAKEDDIALEAKEADVAVDAKEALVAIEAKDELTATEADVANEDDTALELLTAKEADVALDAKEAEAIEPEMFIPPVAVILPVTITSSSEMMPLRATNWLLAIIYYFSSLSLKWVCNKYSEK